MILVDTSVRIDHLRTGDETLRRLLERTRVLSRPFVIGEIALGASAKRDLVLSASRGLPRAVVAADEEVLACSERHALHGLGIGYVDAHLPSATLLTPGTFLWTRDKRLKTAADRLGVALNEA